VDIKRKKGKRWKTRNFIYEKQTYTSKSEINGCDWRWLFVLECRYAL